MAADRGARPGARQVTEGGDRRAAAQRGPGPRPGRGAPAFARAAAGTGAEGRAEPPPRRRPEARAPLTATPGLPGLGRARQGRAAVASAPDGASYGDGVRRPSEAGRAPLPVPRRGEAPALRKRLRGGTSRPWPEAAAGKRPAVKADGSLGAWARPFLSPRLRHGRGPGRQVPEASPCV